MSNHQGSACCTSAKLMPQSKNPGSEKLAFKLMSFYCGKNTRMFYDLHRKLFFKNSQWVSQRVFLQYYFQAVLIPEEVVLSGVFQTALYFLTLIIIWCSVVVSERSRQRALTCVRISCGGRYGFFCHQQVIGCVWLGGLIGEMSPCGMDGRRDGTGNEQNAAFSTTTVTALEFGRRVLCLSVWLVHFLEPTERRERRRS